MNEEEKRKQIECFTKRGMPWDEAQKLVELTEAKQRGALDKGGQQQLNNLMAELEQMMSCLA